MSYDPEVIVTKLPNLIDGIESVWGQKLTESIDYLEVFANKTGVPKTIETIKNLKSCVEALQTDVKGFVGQDGDRVEEVGTLYAQVSAARTIMQAVTED